MACTDIEVISSDLRCLVNESLLGEYSNCHDVMRSTRLFQLVITLNPEQNLTFMYYLVICIGAIFCDVVFNLMYDE